MDKKYVIYSTIGVILSFLFIFFLGYIEGARAVRSQIEEESAPKEVLIDQQVKSAPSGKKLNLKPLKRALAWILMR